MVQEQENGFWGSFRLIQCRSLFRLYCDVVKQRENLAGRNGLAYRKRGPKSY